MSETPWYQAFFGEDYLRIYLPFLPPDRTVREIKGIIKLLKLPTGKAILDLCCGYGRHAIPLAQQGYQITGLDLSAPFIQRAQEKSEAQGVKANWIEGDMRTIPFENEFDAVINIFTSFGYFEDENEDMTVLQQVHKALKPGGLFLLETIHQPRVIRAFTPHGIIRYEDGLLVLEERKIDLRASRNDVRITMFYPDGRRAEHFQSIRIYTLTELVRMLTAVGLAVEGYYGDLEGNALTLDSRLVVLSRKTS
ncbi:MAG TPA: methyltransferase domain-containing protein [Ktedonobacteraceae bacterium]|nr:methyltransferase domain-containing protein [Ktedonobacteraceae bacterium]